MNRNQKFLRKLNLKERVRADEAIELIISKERDQVLVRLFLLVLEMIILTKYSNH